MLTSFQDPGIDDSMLTKHLYCRRNCHHMVNYTFLGNAFSEAVLGDKRPVRLIDPYMQDIM